MDATSDTTSALKASAAPEPRANVVTLVTTVEPAAMAVTSTALASVPAAVAMIVWKPAMKVVSKAVSTNGYSSRVKVMELSTVSILSLVEVELDVGIVYVCKRTSLSLILVSFSYWVNAEE
jgi:hypothetical protein